MKKTLLIILGVLLIFIVGGVWAFLFIFGTPNEGEGGIFAKFGAGDNESVITDTNPSMVDTAPVDQSGAFQRLRQLTTKPVAGAAFISGGIRYVERGTGHIYDIMFSTGNETAVSSFTIARVVDAVFSPTGEHVALTTESVDGNNIYIGNIPEAGGNTELTGVYLPTGAREVAFNNVGTGVYYINDTLSGASGYTYDVEDEKSTLLFTIPLRDVRILWGNTNYAYTTPSNEQTGYLYKLTNSNFSSITSGTGLMAMKHEEMLVVTNEKNNIPESFILDDDTQLSLGLVALPEKCAGVTPNNATSSLVCADSYGVHDSKLPDDWYKGLVSFTDKLWEIDLDTGNAHLLNDISSESGRNIDVAKIGTNDTGEYIYFINKNDDSLWMYDTTL